MTSPIAQTGAGAASCPACGSPSVQALAIAKKDVGAAILAEYFAGTAAGVAAGTKTVIQNVCTKCGAQWFPGTELERRMRAISGQLGDAAKADEEARLGAERAAAEAGRKEADKSSQALLIILIVVLVIILGLIALGPNR